MVKQEFNENARKRLLSLFEAYLSGKDDAIADAEEVYKEFSAAVGTLLDRNVSKAVVYAGKLWIEGSLPHKTVRSLINSLDN